MGRFAITWRDVVFNNGTSSMANLVDGSGSTGFNMYGLAGFSRFDSTGRIKDLAEQSYSADSVGAGVRIAGQMLFALSTRSSSVDPTPTPGDGQAPAGQNALSPDQSSVSGGCGALMPHGEAAFSLLLLMLGGFEVMRRRRDQ